MDKTATYREVQYMIRKGEAHCCKMVQMKSNSDCRVLSNKYKMSYNKSIKYTLFYTEIINKKIKDANIAVCYRNAAQQNQYNHRETKDKKSKMQVAHTADFTEKQQLRM